MLKKVLFATKPVTPKVNQNDRRAERRETREHAKAAPDGLVCGLCYHREAAHGPMSNSLPDHEKGTINSGNLSYRTLANDFREEVRPSPRNAKEIRRTIAKWVR